MRGSAIQFSGGGQQPRDYRYEWIWEKGNATGFLNAKKQPLRAHESAQVFTGASRSTTRR